MLDDVVDTAVVEVFCDDNAFPKTKLAPDIELPLLHVRVTVVGVVPFWSDLTISCFASDVFVPGLVRFIFIFNPLSSVA